MKVLIGVDGSAGAHAAVELAGRLLYPGTNQITLYCTPPEMTVRSGDPADPRTLEHMQELLTEAVFREAQQKLPPPWRNHVRTLVGVQRPGPGLLAAAENLRAELIVVGARGSGSPGKFGVGSVVRKVVHNSTAPVLIARPSPHATSPTNFRVLLASDGSAASRCAGEFLSQLAWPPKTVGEVIYVLEPQLSGPTPDWLEEQLVERETDSLGLGRFRPESEKPVRSERMAAWCGALPAIFLEQTPILAEGRPADAILRTIEQDGIDLVVVGARGLHAVERLLLGSTSEQLLTQAPCSVLIMPHGEQP